MSTHGTIPGYCPMGCGSTLFTGKGGHVTCSFVDCPNPSAVDTLLRDTETEHVVTITEGGFTVRHPLRERVGGQLEDCDLHLRIAEQLRAPVLPGRYRVTHTTGDPSSWFELVGDAS